MTNRQKALNLALGTFFSKIIDAEEYEELDEDQLEDMLFEGEIIIWQPFEYWHLRDVLSEVEALAYNVEQLLMKEKIEILRIIENGIEPGSVKR